jgi:hypothetical protein
MSPSSSGMKKKPSKKQRESRWKAKLTEAGDGGEMFHRNVG